MNWSVIGESLPVYGQAALLTIWIAVWGVLAALAVGLLCAAIQTFRIPLLAHIVGAYIELSRNTPLLVQLFFLYFGLPKMGIVLDGFTCAVVGLAFLGGSYMAEALRSGIEAVDRVHIQSGLSLGMRREQVLQHIVLPQAFSTAMPALTANVIFLVKETSVVSILALPDLVYVAKEQIGNTYDTSEALVLLVLFYLLILLPVSLIARHLEGRLRHASFGH